MKTQAKMSRLQRITARWVFPVTMASSLLVMGLTISTSGSLLWVSMGITGMVLAVGAGLERWIPYADAPREEGELKTDLGSLAIAVGLVEPALAAVTPILVTCLSVGLLPDSLQLFPAQAPLWMQFLLVTLVAELGRYWAHRLSHENEVLWGFHAMHHSPHRVDLLNNFRIHPINQIFSHLLAIVPLVWLGAGPEVMMLYNVFYSVGIVFQHLDADLDHGIWNRWFSTNTIHRWHHSNRAPEGDTNYGAVLIGWDRLFGTYFAPVGQVPTAYGLYDERGYPVHEILPQLLLPFYGPKRTCCPA